MLMGHGHSQLPESLIVSMTTQIETRPNWKTTEMARWSLRRPTYVPINLHKPPKMTNSTSTNVTLGGAWCNIMVTNKNTAILLSINKWRWRNVTANNSPPNKVIVQRLKQMQFEPNIIRLKLMQSIILLLMYF